MTAIPRCTQDQRGPQRVPEYEFSQILKVFLRQLGVPTTFRKSFPSDPLETSKDPLGTNTGAFDSDTKRAILLKT